MSKMQLIHQLQLIERAIDRIAIVAIRPIHVVH
jgi:hypothetical protein